MSKAINKDTQTSRGRRPGVCIVNFEQISLLFLVFR